MRYQVDLTCIYNGIMYVEADSEDEAIEKAQDLLNYKTLKEFPNSVDIPNGGFSFGEATADYAQLINN